ncbi:type I restriction-modification system specificity subunit [Lentilactobacillus diolivorans DSM 14421]|uniref:Type I restriction-modification system specificity subunit n=2 Tax=Lentilactobacillus diolivorans TaxID=179838 RepID=A0A0R1SJ63_9LACO|nr:type I restriction-modification system specificity subunit [Lentilactobacillus diolivorans DSM 14421]
MISQNRRLTMKDNQAKYPQLRFKGFTDPWEERKFKDNIVSIQTGTNLLGSAVNEGTPLIKMGNLQRGYFSFKKLEYLDSNSNVGSEDIVNYGDFLFNTRNTLELVGKGATWTGISGKYAFNSNIARFKFDGIDTIFFNYLYNTQQVISQVHARAVGTTSVSAVYPRDLNSLLYYLPSIEEQQKIGSFFKQLDDTITLHQRKLAMLKELKQGYLQKLFPQNGSKFPQLRFAGFADAWEQRKLGELGLNISDGDWIEKQHIFENGQYRIIQTGNIGVDEYLDKPQNAKYFRQEDFNQLKANEIFPGDIVVCRLADPAGRAVILPNIGKQMVTSVDVAILRPSSKISFRFLVSQLNNPRNLKQVQIMASGSTRTRISRKNLEREIIQLPNINEQKKIGSFFSILNSTIALHQRKLEKLQELKKGYLQKMFC